MTLTRTHTIVSATSSAMALAISSAWTAAASSAAPGASPGVRIWAASHRQAPRVVLENEQAGQLGSRPAHRADVSHEIRTVSRRGMLFGGATVIGAAVGGTNSLFAPPSGASDLKQTNLPIEEVKKIIEADITQRQYPVTGNLTESIYDENCRFQDPTVDVSGLKKYTAALQTLFDPASSKHEILGIEVTGPNTVEQSWRLTGYLKLPWRPYIPPYEGKTTYKTNERGLIVSHSETWSISIFTALVQLLTPSWFIKDAPK